MTADSAPADEVTLAATAQRQPDSASEMLGDAVWLMSQSAAHKHLSISDLEWLVLPPIMAKQFRFFRTGNRPFAFATWALLDEDAEKRLLAGQTRLRAGDWKSGDRLWLIDLVAPFGGAEGVLSLLKQRLFGDRQLMVFQPKQDGGRAVATEIGTR